MYTIFPVVYFEMDDLSLSLSLSVSRSPSLSPKLFTDGWNIRQTQGVDGLQLGGLIASRDVLTKYLFLTESIIESLTLVSNLGLATF